MYNLISLEARFILVLRFGRLRSAKISTWLRNATQLLKRNDLSLIHDLPVEMRPDGARRPVTESAVLDVKDTNSKALTPG